MVIPSVDYSPIFRAFNAYAGAKEYEANNGMQALDTLFTLGRVGLGIVETAGNYYVKNDQLKAQQHVQGIQNKFQRLEDEYTRGNLAPQEYQDAADALRGELTTYCPNTPEGQAIIDEYKLNGLNPNIAAATKRTLPDLLKQIGGAVDKTTRDDAAQSIESEAAYLEGMEAVDGAVAAAQRQTSKAEEDLGQLPQKREEAKKASEQKIAERKQGYTGETGTDSAVNYGETMQRQAIEEAQKNSLEIDKPFDEEERGLSAKAEEARAVQAAATAEQERYRKGADAFAERVRKNVIDSGLLPAWKTAEIDQYVSRAVLYRNNLLATKRVSQALSGNDFAGATEYVEDHGSYYESKDAQEKVLRDIEDAKQGFAGKLNQYYLGEITRAEVWENPSALKRWRFIIENEGENGERQKTSWDYGLHNSPEKRKLLDYLDNRLSELNVRIGSEKETLVNDGWKIVMQYQGQLGEKSTINKQTAEMMIDQLLPKGLPTKEAMAMKDAILEFSLKDSEYGKDRFEDFKAWGEDYLGPTAKRDETSDKYMKKKSRWDFFKNDMVQWLRENPQGTDTEYQAKKKELAAAIFSEDAIDALTKPVTRGGFGQPGPDVQYAKKYALIEEGKIDAFIRYNSQTGAREILPEAAESVAGLETYLASELKKHDSTAAVGENVIPYMDEDGSMTYFKKRKDGGYDTYIPHADTKKGGVQWTKNGEKITAPMNAKMAELAKKITGNATISPEEAKKYSADLKELYEGPAGKQLSPQEKKAYKSMKQHVDNIVYWNSMEETAASKAGSKSFGSGPYSAGGR